jgi:hypothetical protein
MSLCRLKRTREYNIEMDLKELGRENMDLL